MGKHRKTKQPTEITFNKTKRKEFLTGFSKRKKQRQEQAKNELEAQIKEEKLKMKADIRNARNMNLHNDVVKNRLKQLRNLEGLNEETKVCKEEDGREVETCDIAMTNDFSVLGAEVEAKDAEAKEAAKEAKSATAPSEPTLLSIDNEANRKVDAEKSKSDSLSRTKQKKMHTKAGQLQKLANVSNRGKVVVKKGNKKALHQLKNNRTLGKRAKHKKKVASGKAGMPEGKWSSERMIFVLCSDLNAKITNKILDHVETKKKKYKNMTTPARRRLMRDFKFLQKDPPMGIQGSPQENNIMIWDAVIYGPADTPFEDGTFKLQIEFSEEYPNKPPKVKFISSMFHPNVYSDGSLCLDILQNRWSPSYDVSSILRLWSWDHWSQRPSLGSYLTNAQWSSSPLPSIQSLLDEPNPSSPANAEAAKLFQENRCEYEKRIQKIVEASWLDFDDLSSGSEEEDDDDDEEENGEGSSNEAAKGSGDGNNATDKSSNSAIRLEDIIDNVEAYSCSHDSEIWENFEKKKLEKSKMKKKYFDTTQPKTEARISPFSMKD